VTWAKGIRADGTPEVNKEIPGKEGKRVCPGALGLTNWYSPSYNPETKLLYIATSTECDIFTSSPQTYRAGHDFLGSIYVPDAKERLTGSLKAIDPLTGNQKWEFPYFLNPAGGALSTATGLVFASDTDGNFIALDAGSGRDLWHRQVG